MSLPHECDYETRSYSSQTPPPTMQGGAIFTVGCKVGVCCYHPLWLDGTQPDRYLPFANSANNQICPTCVAVMRMRCSRNRRIRRLMNYCVFYVLGSTSNSRKARRAPFEWPRTTCGGLQNATRTLCAIREGACRCRRRAPDVVCPRCDSWWADPMVWVALHGWLLPRSLVSWAVTGMPLLWIGHAVRGAKGLPVSTWPHRWICVPTSPAPICQAVWVLRPQKADICTSGT